MGRGGARWGEVGRRGGRSGASEVHILSVVLVSQSSTRSHVVVSVNDFDIFHDLCSPLQLLGHTAGRRVASRPRPSYASLMRRGRMTHCVAAAWCTAPDASRPRDALRPRPRDALHRSRVKRWAIDNSTNHHAPPRAPGPCPLRIRSSVWLGFRGRWGRGGGCEEGESDGGRPGNQQNSVAILAQFPVSRVAPSARLAMWYVPASRVAHSAKPPTTWRAPLQHAGGPLPLAVIDDTEGGNQRWFIFMDGAVFGDFAVSPMWDS